MELIGQYNSDGRLPRTILKRKSPTEFSGIPWNKICKGVSLCYSNAQRLIDAANAYIRSKYVGPGPIDPKYFEEITYGSCSGLTILALEEIGKGFFLFEKHQRHEDVREDEWKQYSHGWQAHLEKIGKAQELLGLENPELAKQLNQIKKRDIYVDWINNDWQSPNSLPINNQEVINISNLASRALCILRELLIQNNIPTDPKFLELFKLFWTESTPT